MKHPHIPKKNPRRHSNFTRLLLVCFCQTQNWIIIIGPFCQEIDEGDDDRFFDASLHSIFRRAVRWPIITAGRSVRLNVSTIWTLFTRFYCRRSSIQGCGWISRKNLPKNGHHSSSFSLVVHNFDATDNNCHNDIASAVHCSPNLRLSDAKLLFVHVIDDS